MSDALATRLEAAVARLEAAVGALGGAAAAPEEKVSAAVAEYDAYLSASVAPLVATCKALDLGELAADVDKAFGFQRTLFQASGECKKPAQKALLAFVAPIVEVVTRAGERPDNRSASFNYDKSWAEASALFNWLFVPTPVGHISEMKDAAAFYTTKILVAAKGEADAARQAAMRAFVKQLQAAIVELAAFVKRNFTTGVVWNAKGGDLASYKAGAASVPSAPAAPPAPPAAPPAPPAPAAGAAAPKKAAGGGMAAVFGELNKGTAITAGLKKVTKDMKTKNRKDDGTAPPVPRAAPKKAAPKPAAAKAAVKKEPTLALRQGTWFAENYEDDTVEIDQCQMRQSVYVYGCKKSTIIISSPKVKSIQLDNCERVRLQFNAVVSTFEVVRCKRLNIHVMVQCNSLAVDQSQGVHIHLTKESSNPAPQFVTSAVSEMTVAVPGATDDADPVEMPLPEQYISLYKDGKFVTEPVSHSG